MAVRVRIPVPLQKITENKSEVEVEVSGISELLDNLDKKLSPIFAGQRLQRVWGSMYYVGSREAVSVFL